MTIGPEVSLALLMAMRQQTLLPEHVFAPVVTLGDLRLIALTAQIAEAFAEGRLDGASLRATLVAVPRPREVSAPGFCEFGVGAGDAFGVALGFCYVPVGTVDRMLAAALTGPPRARLPTAADLIIDVAREAARRAEARAAFAELGAPEARSRTAQFARSMRAILSRPATLRDALEVIAAGHWGQAEASCRNKADPGDASPARDTREPHLSDVVTLSLIPTCEMLMIGRRLLMQHLCPG